MKLGLYTAQLKDGDLINFPLLNYIREGVLDIQQRERLSLKCKETVSLIFQILRN